MSRQKRGQWFPDGPPFAVVAGRALADLRRRGSAHPGRAMLRMLWAGRPWGDKLARMRAEIAAHPDLYPRASLTPEAWEQLGGTAADFPRL